MKRVFEFAGVRWLSALLLSAADQKAGGGANKVLPPGARKVAPGRPKAEPAPTTPNVPMRALNPRNIAAQLYQATPEQRDRVIEKLPPARQEQLRKQLEWYDGLPKAQQKRIIESTERVAQLTPEREHEVIQSWRGLQQLPQDRKIAIRQAFNRIQGMTPERREAVFNSDQFKNRFSPEEQKIIRDLCDIVPPM